MNWLRRVRARTIWEPGAIPPEDARIAGLLRVTLLVVDLLLIGFGIAAVVYGLPILAEVFFGWVAVIFGAAVGTFALVALFGLAFMLPRVEAVAKIALMTVFVFYPFFLLFGTLTAGRVAAGILCLIPIPILFWRVGDLGREKGKKS